MIGIVAYLATLTAISALTLGHHNQDFPPRRLWRAWRTHTAANSHPPAPDAEEITSEPAARRPPTWARTDHHTYEEAA